MKNKILKLSSIIMLSVISIATTLLIIVCLQIKVCFVTITASLFIFYFLVILWAKVLGYDTIVRRKKFLQTGNLDDIKIDDMSDPVLYQYLIDPDKLKDLQETIKNKKIEEKREIIIKKLLE